MLESEIEDRLVELAQKAGGEIRKVQWLGRDGAPDRVLFLPEGWIFWIELKKPGYEETPRVRRQRREHKRLQDMDQIVKVFDSIEQVENFMEPFLAEADLRPSSVSTIDT